MGGSGKPAARGQKQRVRIRIVAVGHKMPTWVEQGCADYIKRMPREIAVESVEIKPARRTPGKSTEQVREAEAQRILQAVGRDSLIVLDERGQQWTTFQLADQLRLWMAHGQDVALVIGGADGLHEHVRQAARAQWSLSRLTLPHGMVRVLVAEQLYRAWSILSNHPYHRGDA